eukprot:8391346-Alexandrium_andersonii.AAC.1
MSASLVGSEMCIRDRPLPNSTRARWATTSGQRLIQRWLIAYTCLNSAPVSYTHLTLPTICSV